MRKEFGKLLSVNEVRELIKNRLVLPIEPEIINVENSMGRMIFIDICAGKDNPILPRSAMDGFAVRSKDTMEAAGENEVEITISGEVRIGEFPEHQDGDRICIRIATGGYVPESFDAVVPVEQTEEYDGKIIINNRYRPGENIDPKGSDYKEGEVLLRRGTIIKSKDILAMTSLGKGSVEVLKKVKVAVSPTGNELVPFGSKAPDFSIYDSNSWGVKTALEEVGQFEVRHHGILRDEESLVSEAMAVMLKQSDLVITTGGTSTGEKDLVYKVLEEYEPGIIFHGIGTKPGMPSLFAIAGGKPVIGLPGPPVSAMMVLYELFIPGMLENLGISGLPVKIRARLGERARITRSRYNMIPVALNQESGREPVVYPLPGGSGAVSRLAKAQGYIVHPGGLDFLEAGTEVMVMPFSRILL